MKQRNKAEVYIYGNKYKVSGTESEEYMHKIALYIDKKMREIGERNSVLSDNMISVLAAMNVVDEYFKSQEKLKQAAGEAGLSVEMERLTDENEKLKEEIKRLKDEYTQMESFLMEEYSKLKEEYEKKGAGDING